LPICPFCVILGFAQQNLYGGCARGTNVIFFHTMSFRKGSSSEKASRKPQERWTTCYNEIRIHCPRTKAGLCVHRRRPTRCSLCLAAVCSACFLSCKRCPGCSMKGKVDKKCPLHKAQIGECLSCSALRSALESTTESTVTLTKAAAQMDAADYLCKDDGKNHFVWVTRFCAECESARGTKHALHWRRMCPSHKKAVKKCGKCRSI
jgi:hypothetical protein